jgi:hypothetical protein
MDSKDELSLKKCLSLVLSMKYITNATIFASVIGYYTQAYWIFFVSIPLLITNAIVITLIEWFNSDELISALLDIPLSQKARLKSVKTQIIALNSIWHWLPLAWVYYVIGKDNLIEIFRPNFMGIFLAEALFGIGYFYFASQGKYYGEIDYTWYMIVYIVILLTVNIVVFGV